MSKLREFDPERYLSLADCLEVIAELQAENERLRKTLWRIHAMSEFNNPSSEVMGAEAKEALQGEGE